jgi:DNA-binding NarL/FixJ family response regulator
MEAPNPSAQTTLLILLGASAWPLFPEFERSEAFANAMRGLKDYFLNPQQFGLPTENLLDLFDLTYSPDKLDIEIGQFLERRIAAMKTMGKAARDVVFYFVGHGYFIGRDSDFFLAIRRTRRDNPRVSGLQMLSLADTLTEKARHLRWIIILDCCFAAAAFSAFQAGPAQVAIEKTIDAFEVGGKRTGFPRKGTALLCSSNHKSPSLLFPDGSSTMFTKALLDALAQGTSFRHKRLSLRDVTVLAADVLKNIRNAPMPVVHSPDQSEGDVADIPFFPNPLVKEIGSTLLSAREREVLLLMTEGYTNQEIARRHVVAPKTVVNQVSSIFKKLGVTNRVQAIVHAKEFGLEDERVRPAPLTELSAREREVLHLMVQGYKNREIADRLGITLKTLTHHISSIYRKLGVTNRSQAVTLAKASGIE